ncbi:MAG TPA: tetratricopeptide repeat protein [Polyangia bacterium]|nr:tetratricopeptide repeat protein [Polyangia bacterium]
MLAAGALAAASVSTAVEAAPDSREARARAACAAGNVEKGVALLAQIAAQTGDVNALYNQARCYQQNGRTDEALERFKEYRRLAPDLSPDEAAQVNTYIRDLEAEQARNAAAAAPVPPAPAPTPPAPSAPPPPAPAMQPEGSHPSLVAPAILAGAGVAALAAGIYFSLKVRSIESDLESSTPITTAAYNDQVQSGQHAATFQWVSYGIAAAAAAGSVLTFALGRPAAAGAEAPHLGFAPAIGRDGVGGVVRFAF